MPRSTPIAPSSGERLVLDTSTARAELMSGEMPGRWIDPAVADPVEQVSSAALLAGWQGARSLKNFARQFAKRGLTVGDVFDSHAAMATPVAPTEFRRG